MYTYSFVIDLSDFIAGLALVVSIWALVSSGGLRRLQAKLTGLQIKEIDDDSEAAKSADVRFEFKHDGGTRWQIEVSNMGPAVAKNINLSFDEGGDLIVSTERSTKLPIDLLEPNANKLIRLGPQLRHDQAYKVTVGWDDETGTRQSKSKDLTM